MEFAFKKLFSIDAKVHSASRTDAGVHAFGQVANIIIDKDISDFSLRSALNSVLPFDIRIISVNTVSMDFNARRDAVGKLYEYRIFNRNVSSPFERLRSWFIPYKIDIDAMTDASKHLLGIHDFSSFFKRERKRKVNPVRQIDKIDITMNGFNVVINILGRSFLRHMVRAIVATLIEVGKGKLSPDSVKSILEKGNRKFAPFVAPPYGLYLKRVYYDNYPC